MGKTYQHAKNSMILEVHRIKQRKASGLLVYLRTEKSLAKKCYLEIEQN
jgi:hypothetical protein